MHRSWQKEKNDGDSELDAIKEQIRQLKNEMETSENRVDGLVAENASQAGTISEIQAEIERLKRETAMTSAPAEKGGAGTTDSGDNETLAQS
jgi:peptidoglycan hydrolase CwlO-like protein